MQSPVDILEPGAQSKTAAAALGQPQSGELVRDGVVEVFAAEFVTCWRQVPNKLLFGILLGVWVLLFQFMGNSTFGYLNTSSIFEWMWPAGLPTDNEFDSGPGILLPLVVAGLFWWKRRELLALPLAAWPLGLGILAFAILLHIVGYMVQQPRISIVALYVGIYGLMGMAWGARFMWRAFLPYAFFIFAIPLGSLSVGITFRLRMVVTVLVEFIANYLLGMDLVREGTGLFDPSKTYQFDVAPACSGIRSLMAVFFLCAVYGYVIFRHSWWRWFVLMVAAFPLAVLGNMLRLLTIVLAADLFGQETGNAVHDSALFSLSPYVPAILGMILLARWLERDTKPAAGTGETATTTGGKV
jgi:exosortase